MGCTRFVWNAKCDEDKYFRGFAHKFTPFKYYYQTQDTKYSHFKSDELSSWLSKCPSQILRNSVTNWYETLNKSIKGGCGRPKRKAKTDKGSIYLTRELFKFERNSHVHCHTGSLEIFPTFKSSRKLVHCHTGSLEKRLHRQLWQ